MVSAIAVDGFSKRCMEHWMQQTDGLPIILPYFGPQGLSRARLRHAILHIQVGGYGDDFITVARKAGRERTIKLLEDHFEIKSSTAGPCDGMPKELKVLGRIATCHKWGWTLEADPSLLENAVDRLDMHQAKGVGTPGAKDDNGCSATDVRVQRLHPEQMARPDVEWPGYDESKALGYDDIQLY